MSGQCPQSPPVNKEAVIAIQGGGIYALPMLGQARVILDDAGYVPLAFAGNSGGAILATLLWSSLKPRRIETAFTDLLKNDKEAFVNLLLPVDTNANTIRLAGLRLIPERVRSLLPLPSGPIRGAAWCWNNMASARRLVGDIMHLWNARGAFTGERFVQFVDGLVKEGLGLQHLTGLAEFKDVPRDSARPPLLLTVTNVSRGKLEVIDSTDPTYEKVPIALAVRASAGFPGFFQPIDLPGAGEGRCFIDGGMIANFPLWVFSASFRERLEEKNKGHGWLAMRPWLPIGLRVRDDVAASYRDMSTPMDYFRRLALIATGMARNDLEDRLVSATLSNQMTVDQPARSLPQNPRTGKPIDVLDVEAVTPENIGTIIETGVTAAQAELLKRGAYQVYDPGCGPAVLERLEDLISRCTHAMNADDDLLKFRANIFIPEKTRMCMRFGARMEGYPDDGLYFENVAQGLTGFCYQTRSPAICNLLTIAQIASNTDLAVRPYGMDTRQQRAIDPGRSWLISYPIFDPAERQVLRMPPQGLPATYAPAMHRLTADHIGPVLGVLNVDAGWNYNGLELLPSPDLHAGDPRIKGVIDAVAQASVRIARLLVGQAALET